MKLGITKTLAAASATFGLAMFAACEDASSTVSSERTTTSSNTPAGITVVDSYKSLPDCKKSNAGAMAYVGSTSDVYYCVESKWVSINGKNGADGKNGTDGKNGVDGKNGENGKDGTDGTDGTGCSADLAEDVILVKCAGVIIDSITNGKNGSDGTNGANGKKGETGDDGKDGSNGANCSAKTIAEGVEISCAGIVIDTLTSGKNGANGTNGTSCSAKSITEGIEVSCAGSVVDTLTNGKNGTNGTNCSARSITEGIEVSCAGEVVDTLTNGKNGSNGSDGTSCSARETSAGIAISCGNVITAAITKRTDGSDAQLVEATNGTTCTITPYTDPFNYSKSGYKLICDGEEKGILWNGINANGSGLCSFEHEKSGIVKVTCGEQVAYINGFSYTDKVNSFTNCAGKTYEPGNHNLSVTVDGKERTFIMRVPATYTGDKPVPLFVDYHPLGGTSSSHMNSSDYKTYTDAFGGISLYPQGTVKGTGGYSGSLAGWNVGPCCSNDNDIKFTLEMIGMVEEMVCIDNRRVYAAGFDMGGGMANYVACVMSDIFTAVAPAAMDLNTTIKNYCFQERPVSIIMFRGTDDETCRYEGGDSGNNDGLNFLGAEENFKFWAEMNQCIGAPTTNKDGCQEYSNCKDDSKVVLCTKQGGGHDYGDASIGWPFLSSFVMNY